MNQGKWNLDLNGFSSVRIIQISFNSTCKRSSSQEINKQRLHVLAHQISSLGVPCLYFNELTDFPVQISLTKNNPAILVYDFFSNFDQIELPIWSEQKDFILHFESPTNLSRHILEHIQLSFVLYYYYQHQNNHPLYFSTFLLFPSDENFLYPFVFRPIPVIRSGKLYLRNISSIFPDILIDPPFQLEFNSFILVEPFPHPFFVEEIGSKSIIESDESKSEINSNETTKFVKLRNIDQNILIKEVNENFHYVLYTTIPSYISKMHISHQEIEDDENNKPIFSTFSNFSISNPPPKESFNFETKEFFDFEHSNFSTFLELAHQLKEEEDFEYYEEDDDEPDYFIIKKDKKPRKKRKRRPIEEGSCIFDSQTSYFTFPDITYTTIINEEITNKGIREILTNSFKRFAEERLPNLTELNLPSISFPSFFEFAIPLRKSQPFKSTTCFTHYAPIEIQKIHHPSVLVNGNGTPHETSPTSIFTEWKTNHYLPISGRKSGTFVVFIVDVDIEINKVMDYFDSLIVAFTTYELGDLKPYREAETFIKTTEKDLYEVASNFFEVDKSNSQTLSEFQQQPLLPFIICHPYFNQTMMQHSLFTTIPIQKVRSIKQSEIDHLAFIVYNRIRTFNPSPFGRINLPPPILASLFFGYRYQHPYHLARYSKDKLTLHIVWDPNTLAATFIDDIGSVLHTFQNQNLTNLIIHISSLIQHLKNLVVNITFSILGESAQTELISSAISLFSQANINNFSIFSIVPTPQIQFMVDHDGNEDFVVFDDPELTITTNYSPAVPTATCYVAAVDQPVYRISYFYNSKGSEPKKCLTDFATEMSNLSWLSVNVETNTREYSYPPNLAVLLQKIQVKTSVVTGFDFLTA